MPKVKMRTFDRHGRCPMCGKDFRSECKHSVAQVECWLVDDYTKRLVRKEMKKANQRGIDG